MPRIVDTSKSPVSSRRSCRHAPKLAALAVALTLSVTAPPAASAQTGFAGPPGWEIWVMSYHEDKVYVLDTADLSVKMEIDIAGGPNAVAFGRDGAGVERAFVALEDISRVGVVDAAEGIVEGILSPGSLAGTNMVSSPDGSRVYVLSCAADIEVLDIDAADLSVRTLPITNAWSMDFSDDGTRGYIMHCFDWIPGWQDELLEIDVAGGAVVRPIPFGPVLASFQPVDFVTVPGTSLALFVTQAAHLVTLDLPSAQYVGERLDFGGLAHDLAWQRVVKDLQGTIYARANSARPDEPGLGHVARIHVDAAGDPVLPYTDWELLNNGPMTSGIGWGYDLAAWEGHAVSPSQDDVAGEGRLEIFEVPDGLPTAPLETVHIGNGVFEVEVREVPLTEQGQELMDLVLALEGITASTPGPGPRAAGSIQSLITKVEGAIRALERDRLNAARGKLHDFIDQVEAMIRSGQLTEARGRPLVSKARGIIRQL